MCSEQSTLLGWASHGGAEDFEAGDFEAGDFEAGDFEAGDFEAGDFEAAIDDVFAQLLREIGGLVELERDDRWQLHPQAPGAAGASCLHSGSSIVYQVATNHSDGGLGEREAADPHSLEFIRDVGGTAHPLPAVALTAVTH